MRNSRISFRSFLKNHIVINCIFFRICNIREFCYSFVWVFLINISHVYVGYVFGYRWVSLISIYHVYINFSILLPFCNTKYISV